MTFDQQGQQVDTQLNVGGDANIDAIHAGQVVVYSSGAPPEAKRVLEPPPMTHNFFGRTAELAALSAAVARGEKVLVHGLPGVGKATLANELWRRLQEKGTFPKGCIWVDNLGDRDISAICDAIAYALGDQQMFALPAHIKKQALRALLDGNPGHLIVLEDVASVEAIDAFVQSCLGPGNTLVVTGPGQVSTLHVEPLLVQEVEPETAVALFRHCARMAATGQEDAVATICESLAYHPEALVVAAGLMRQRGWTAGRLLDRLQRNLDKTLARGHRRFWTSFGAAYEALTPLQKKVIDTLAVAPGTSMSVELLARVCELDEFEREDVPDDLVRLAQVQRKHAGGALRVQKLYRRFIRNEVGEEAATIRRQIAYATAPFISEMRAKGEAGADILETELNNVLPAIETALDHHDWQVVGDIAWPLSHTSRGILGRRGYWPQLARVCEQGLQAALALGNELRSAQFRHRLAVVRQQMGAYEEARRLYDENEPYFRQTGNEQGLAFTLNSLGELARMGGRLDTARQYIDECLALKRKLGMSIDTTLHNRGILHFWQGEYDQARASFEESMAGDRAQGDREGEAANRLHLGRLDLLHGRLAEAREHIAAGLAINRALQDKDGILGAQLSQGRLHIITGDYAAARVALAEALAIATRQLHSVLLIAACQYELGVLAYWEGDATAAGEALAASLAAYESLRNPTASARCRHWLGILALEAGDVARAETLLVQSEAVFTELALPREQADAWREWGRLAQARGDTAAARQSYRDAAAQAERLGDVWGRARTLHRLGLLEKEAGDAVAARLALTESVSLFTALESPLVVQAQAALEALS